MTIEVLEDAGAVSARASEIFLEAAAEAVAARGRFFVSLSGGSTPEGLYRRLASEPNKDRIDWARCCFFIGDERNVPPRDERSNLRMIEHALFLPLGIAPEQIASWPGEADRTARLFELELEKAFRAQTSAKHRIFGQEPNPAPSASGAGAEGIPVFDLFLLGLGSDGHTASIFPGTDAVNETRRMAVAVKLPATGETRFTITFPVINSSRRVLILVTGEAKAAAVAGVIEGKADVAQMPARAVRPSNGHLTWLLDRAAAAKLRRP